MSIEKPFQITQNAAPILLERDDALGPAFLLFVRFIIGQPVEQAGVGASLLR